MRGENIVGMLKGKYTGTAEDKIVIVGAHYDTTSRTKGVDDNGSGVTALLQVAKQIGLYILRLWLEQNWLSNNNEVNLGFLLW